VAEGTRLLSGRRSKVYRGFESRPLRKADPPGAAVSTMHTERASKMESISHIPRIAGPTNVRGTFSVAACGVGDEHLVASPFSGVRALAFQWHFANVEKIDVSVTEANVGLERPIMTVDRRVDFALIDDEGQSILVRTMVPIIELTLSVPSSPQPVPRFPPELAELEQVARATAGEPSYRECFLLPDTIVDVELVAREVVHQASLGYRDAPSAGYEAVSIRRLVEVQEGAAGLPITATVSRHVVRWITRLFR
jgi:hypothetical protein